MTHLDPAPLARNLDDALTEHELARVWRGIEARRARAQGRRSVRRAAAWSAPLAAATIAAAVALVARMTPASLAPIARTDGAPLEGTLTEVVRLDDGSSIEPAPGARVAVLASTVDHVALHLVEGIARFAITPGGPRRWTVEGGGVTVEVVGTVFRVARRGAETHVSVERGVVVVRGPSIPDGARRLHAGESLLATRALDPAPAAPPVTLQTDEPAATHEAPHPRARSAEALLHEADRARRTGRVEHAIRLLARIVEQHPSSREAPLAAYTRARLLDEAGRRDEACASYERAIELGLPPALDTAARAACVP